MLKFALIWVCSMALSFEVGQFNITTGTDDVEVPVSFVPKGIIFFWFGNTESTDTVSNADAFTGAGACDGTNNFAYCSFAEDGEGTFLSRSFALGTRCIMVSDIGTSVTGEASLSSFTRSGGDGFTLTIDNAFPRDQRIMFWAFGGDPAFEVNGYQAHTTIENRQDATTGIPDFVMHFASSNEAGRTGGAEANMSNAYGAMMDDGTEGSVIAMCDHNVGTTNTDRQINLSRGIHFDDDSSTIVQRATWVSFDTGPNGVTMNWDAVVAADPVFYFSVTLSGGAECAIGSFDSGTSIGNLTAVTGLGFEPAGVAVLSVAGSDGGGGSPPTLTTHAVFSIGAFDGINSHAQGLSVPNGLGTGVVGTFVEHNECVGHLTTADPPALEGTIRGATLDSDGFTLNQTDADPSARFCLWWAFGPAAAGGAAAITPRSIPRAVQRGVTRGVAA